MEESATGKNRRDAAELLRLVLEGTLSAEEARERWPDKESGDNELDSAFHFLYHFEDDGDIRDQDKAYAKWQIGEIETMISKLSQSAVGRSSTPKNQPL
jgi:hypothetical protein